MNKQMRKMKEEEMRTYEDCLDEYRFWEREVRSIKTFDYPVSVFEKTFQFAQDKLDKACREMLGMN